MGQRPEKLSWKWCRRRSPGMIKIQTATRPSVQIKLKGGNRITAGASGALHQEFRIAKYDDYFAI